VLKSNRELYEFMGVLTSRLRALGATTLEVVVETARHHAAGMNTEFLGESRIALRRVLKDGRRVLTPADLDEIRDIVSQIDAAFGGQE
jgi:hypothetical protein